ncbi:MAG: Na+/H+ antiporter subunit G [Sedimentisphaerales bacterium]|nr:Na+/H+ antiporter subunit G [Sedimentisphaerales bacterium]
MIDFLGYMLVSVGIFFDISGCIGLVRFPDVYNRLQASTKCVTLGTIMILGGTALIIGTGAIAGKAIICAVFILITSPTAAHAISRGAHSAGISLTDKSIIDRYAEEK